MRIARASNFSLPPPPSFFSSQLRFKFMRANSDEKRKSDWWEIRWKLREFKGWKREESKKKISKGSMELKINFFISIAIYDRSSNWLLNYFGRINTNCTLIRRSVRDNFPRIAPRICAIIRNPWWHSIDYERSHAFKRNGLCVRRVIDREEEKEKERERGRFVSIPQLIVSISSHTSRRLIG